MKWILIACFLLLLLLILVFFTKMKVTIDFSHSQDDDTLTIEFKVLFGLIKYKLNVPLIKVDDDSPSLVMKSQLESENGAKKKKDTTQITGEEMLKSFKDFKAFLEHVLSFHRIVRKFLKKVKITELDWYSTIGTGDAAVTGILTGAVWAVKGSIIGLISHYVRLQKEPRIAVQPHFQMKVSQTAFTCMLQFRIGHAIFAGIKIIKFWKGGRPHFRTKPLSTLAQDKTNSV